MKYSDKLFDEISRTVSGIKAIEEEINKVNETISKVERRFTDLKHLISTCEPLSNDEVDCYQNMITHFSEELLTKMKESVMVRKYDVIQTYKNDIENEQTDKD